MKNYAVEWTDYCGNAHRKEYKTIESAMKKVFAVYSWYKNGELYRIPDGTEVI